MKLIGQGAQYKVFDLHNGRVRKIPLNKRQSHEVVKGWYAPDPPPTDAFEIDYVQHAADATKVIARLLTNYPEFSPSLGNPTFEEKSVYTQDKVLSLGDVLKEATPTDAKKYIMQYIESILCHWRYGVSERAYNFTVNNGLTQDGRIILFDFGEITTDQEEVVRRIAKRRWLQAYSYRSLPSDVQNFYQQAMETRITRTALDKYWQTALV